MSLIEIDLTGCMDPEFGVSQSQLASFAPTMDQCRDDFLAEVAASENHFFDLPMQQYQAYQDAREASPLGRVFDVGTGLHDHVDAVVVVGSAEATAPARGIFQSCCDPYHNELSRADRGSRPRMYFTGDTFDNDDLASLLNRLGQRDFRDSPAETQWAILAIDSVCDGSKRWCDESRFAFQALVQQNPDPARFLYTVACDGSWLDQQAKALGCDNVFVLPSGSNDEDLTLSASSLLPSAMLGLDCIKLLEGAVMMNEHFQSSPFLENLVMRFVAVHEQLSQRRGITNRSVRSWPSSLRWLPMWCDSVRCASSDTCTNSEAGDSQSTVITNLISRKPRYDSLVFGEATAAAKMAGSIAIAGQASREAKMPSMTIHLPTVDTRVLGQIFQMMMIATKIEAQL